MQTYFRIIILLFIIIQLSYRQYKRVLNIIASQHIRRQYIGVIV